MKQEPAKVIEYTATDYRVFSGKTLLKKFTDRTKAYAYARGWNSVNKA